MSFFGELRRRNVFRVGIAYLAVAWLLVQVADVVLSNFDTPAWIIQALIFSSALGLPLALVLAWFYELTPEGIKAASDLEAVKGVRFTGRRIDFAIIGLLVLAVGFLLVRSPAEDTAVLPNSVAVLPFENLSPDPNDSYFAAGIHEEVLNQLAKLRNVSVISRTSMLRYADTDLRIPEIGRELNVETVMRGSVRYAGDRVRITAQLIDAETDEQLWSEVYERDVSDVFTIQADIAENIANALEAELSVAEQQSIERIPTDSPEAYRLYLAALGPYASRADELLDRAILLDPTFALAYAEKASLSINRLIGLGTGASPDEALKLERDVREYAERALALDPTLGIAHVSLGFIHQAHWRGADAEREFRRANELSPNQVEILVPYARFERFRGEFGESLALLRRAAELDPKANVPLIQLALTYRFAGDWDAVATANRSLADSRGFADYEGLAMAEAARGNFDEALEALRISEQIEEAPPPFLLAQMAHAYAQAGRPDEAMRLFASIEEAAEEQPVSEAIWARAYIAVGDYQEALRRVELAIADRVSTDFVVLAELAANPWRDPELANPSFRALLDGLWD